MPIRKVRYIREYTLAGSDPLARYLPVDKVCGFDPHTLLVWHTL